MASDTSSAQSAGMVVNYLPNPNSLPSGFVRRQEFRPPNTSAHAPAQPPALPSQVSSSFMMAPFGFLDSATAAAAAHHLSSTASLGQSGQPPEQFLPQTTPGLLQTAPEFSNALAAAAAASTYVNGSLVGNVASQSHLSTTQGTTLQNGVQSQLQGAYTPAGQRSFTSSGFHASSHPQVSLTHSMSQRPNVAVSPAPPNGSSSATTSVMPPQAGTTTPWLRPQLQHYLPPSSTQHMLHHQQQLLNQHHQQQQMMQQHSQAVPPFLLPSERRANALGNCLFSGVPARHSAALHSAQRPSETVAAELDVRADGSFRSANVMPSSFDIQSSNSQSSTAAAAQVRQRLKNSAVSEGERSGSSPKHTVSYTTNSAQLNAKLATNIVGSENQQRVTSPQTGDATEGNFVQPLPSSFSSSASFAPPSFNRYHVPRTNMLHSSQERPSSPPRPTTEGVHNQYFDVQNQQASQILPLGHPGNLPFMWPSNQIRLEAPFSMPHVLPFGLQQQRMFTNVTSLPTLRAGAHSFPGPTVSLPQQHQQQSLRFPAPLSAPLHNFGVNIALRPMAGAKRPRPMYAHADGAIAQQYSLPSVPPYMVSENLDWAAKTHSAIKVTAAHLKQARDFFPSGRVSGHRTDLNEPTTTNQHENEKTRYIDLLLMTPLLCGTERWSRANAETAVAGKADIENISCALPPSTDSTNLATHVPCTMMDDALPPLAPSKLTTKQHFDVFTPQNANNLEPHRLQVSSKSPVTASSVEDSPSACAEAQTSDGPPDVITNVDQQSPVSTTTIGSVLFQGFENEKTLGTPSTLARLSCAPGAYDTEHTAGSDTIGMTLLKNVEIYDATNQDGCPRAHYDAIPARDSAGLAQLNSLSTVGLRPGLTPQPQPLDLILPPTPNSQKLQLTDTAGGGPTITLNDLQEQVEVSVQTPLSDTAQRDLTPEARDVDFEAKDTTVATQHHPTSFQSTSNLLESSSSLTLLSNDNLLSEENHSHALDKVHTPARVGRSPNIRTTGSAAEPESSITYKHGTKEATVSSYPTFSCPIDVPEVPVFAAVLAFLDGPSLSRCEMLCLSTRWVIRHRFTEFWKTVCQEEEEDWQNIVIAQKDWASLLSLFPRATDAAIVFFKLQWLKRQGALQYLAFRERLAELEEKRSLENHHGFGFPSNGTADSTSTYTYKKELQQFFLSQCRKTSQIMSELKVYARNTQKIVRSIRAIGRAFDPQIQEALYAERLLEQPWALADMTVHHRRSHNSNRVSSLPLNKNAHTAALPKDVAAQAEPEPQHVS